MSLFRLGIHSFSIIAVFKRTVFIRSTILILISTYIMKKMFFSVLLFQLMLVIFNLLIYIVSLRENEQELINSDQNEQTSKLYTH
jgi:hypothetical protein